MLQSALCAPRGAEPQTITAPQVASGDTGHRTFAVTPSTPAQDQDGSPRSSALSPQQGRHRGRARVLQRRGPTVSGISSGTRSPTRSLARAREAIGCPPPRGLGVQPLMTIFVGAFVPFVACPSAQKKHEPQPTEMAQVTLDCRRSRARPGHRRALLGRTSSIVPTISCPSTVGVGSVRRPAWVDRSLRHNVQQVTQTREVPASRRRGVGKRTSSSRRRRQGSSGNRCCPGRVSSRAVARTGSYGRQCRADTAPRPSKTMKRKGGKMAGFAAPAAANATNRQPARPNPRPARKAVRLSLMNITNPCE